MTPRDKAIELKLKYIEILQLCDLFKVGDFVDELAKDCALICVDEIINGNFGDGYDHKFWECVKDEIDNL